MSPCARPLPGTTGIIRDKRLACDAKLVGEWPSDGYDFVESNAEKAGKFAGLVIDDDNRPEKTNDRVRQWVEFIRSAMNDSCRERKGIGR